MKKARSDWVDDVILGHLLAALMPANALVLRTARATGLRISDVLGLKTAALTKGQRFSIKEQKTGKVKRIYIPAALRLALLGQAGRLWVFEGRGDWRKHRTRQAINKDLARVAATFRTSGAVRAGQNVTPHSTRKAYAVSELSRTGDLRHVQAELNHSDPEITMLYAMAREVTERKCSRRERAAQRGKQKKGVTAHGKNKH